MSNQLKLKRILSGISLSAVLLSTTVQAETLEEALAYTYVANPTILSQRAYLRSVYEKLPRVFPDISRLCPVKLLTGILIPEQNRPRFLMKKKACRFLSV